MRKKLSSGTIPSVEALSESFRCKRLRWNVVWKRRCCSMLLLLRASVGGGLCGHHRHHVPLIRDTAVHDTYYTF